jgi:hypothetical protein
VFLAFMTLGLLLNLQHISVHRDAIIDSIGPIMANMANILIKDDTATELTFIPVTDTPAPLYRTNNTSIPISGQATLDVSMVKLKSGDFKASVRTIVPVMETLGASGTSGGYVAPPKVAYNVTTITTMYFSKRSTVNDRANALRLHVGSLQNSSSTSGSGTASNTQVAGAWAGLTGPVPTLFVSGILPY